MIFILGLAELNVTSENPVEANVTKVEQPAEEPAVPSAENITEPEVPKHEIVQAEIQNTILHVNLSTVNTKFNTFQVLSHDKVISKEYDYADYE